MWLKHPTLSMVGSYPPCHCPLPGVPSLSGESFTMLNGVHGPGTSIQRECAVPMRVST